MDASTPINHLQVSEPRWFAVRTRSKSEKFVKRMLEKKGVHCYLPIQKLFRKYVRSTRMVEKPLINCYVFVHITRREYVSILETENVTGFVKFNRNLIAIPDAEIDLIRRITLEEGLQLGTVIAEYKEGDLVEIAAGSLMGLKGRIIKKEGKRSFQIELASLGLDLHISVDAAFLEKLPPGSSRFYFE